VRSDEALLLAWRAGDRDAGDELFARHFDPLYRFFSTKVVQEVEDLVQRTFLECLESKAPLHEGNFRAYLFGIARHRLIDFFRSRQRETIDVEEISIADLGTTPSQAFARDENQRLLHQALLSVPLDHQIALELSYWEELSGREIAHVLGVDENTVRSRLSRARTLLRDKLAALTAAPDTDLDSSMYALGRAASAG